MKRLLIIIFFAIGINVQAQSFESTTTIDIYGNTTTVYTDQFGFEIGQKVETTDFYGNINTSYQDVFGFEVGTSTGIYNIYGEYEVKYDFDTYTEPQLDLSLPSLDLYLPYFNPDN